MEYINSQETTTWTSTEDFPLNRKNMDLLFANKIAAIRKEGFASKEECEEVVQATKLIPMEMYRDTFPRIDRIGITQFEHFPEGSGGKEAYFSKVDTANQFQRILEEENKFNPLKKVMQIVSELYPEHTVSIAQEKDGRLYFAGLLRRINSAAFLHFDYAQFDAPDWAISEVVDQISWNVYLTPVKRGQCIVYDRQWTKEIISSCSYPFPLHLVDGRRAKVLTPTCGDLTFFNTCNFHEVRDTPDDRLTMSSFIGRLPSGNFVLWS